MTSVLTVIVDGKRHDDIVAVGIRHVDKSLVLVPTNGKSVEFGVEWSRLVVERGTLAEEEPDGR